MTQKRIAIVPARGGSKGLPGKNVLLFAGKPLFLRAVEQGIEAVGSCVVTTDMAEIRSEDLPDGVLRQQRPASLATDETRMDQVIQNTITEMGLEDDIILLLQVTSPHFRGSS